MSIPYTYEIISVDTQARVMEVVYTSPGRQTMHIGARLPYVGESVESVVHTYAPVAHWLEQEAEVQTPEVGVTGFIDPSQLPQPTPVIELTPLGFMDRFTDAEETAIVAATLVSVDVKKWYDKLLAAQYVSASDPRILSGMAYLVAAGFLTQQRADEILDFQQVTSDTIVLNVGGTA